MITDLQIINSKVADIRDDVMYLRQSKNSYETVDFTDELFEADLAKYFQTKEAFEDFNLELYQEADEQQEILKGA